MLQANSWGLRVCFAVAFFLKPGKDRNAVCINLYYLFSSPVKPPPSVQGTSPAKALDQVHLLHTDITFSSATCDCIAMSHTLPLIAFLLAFLLASSLTVQICPLFLREARAASQWLQFKAAPVADKNALLLHISMHGCFPAADLQPQGSLSQALTFLPHCKSKCFMTEAQAERYWHRN